MILLVPLKGLKSLIELAAGRAGTSNRRHYAQRCSAGLTGLVAAA
jgi:hypothetical protein